MNDAAPLERQLDALLTKGEDAYRAGQLDLAARVFERVLEAHPTHARALADLAATRYDAGDHAAAETLLLKAALHADDPSDAIIDLAAIAEADGRLAEAATLYAHPALGPRRDFDALANTLPTLRARGATLTAHHIAHHIRVGRPPRVDIRGYYEVDILRLEPHQIYPAGAALDPTFFYTAPTPFITRETPIASIGSCFAREVKDYLVTHGYHYIQTADGPHARHGSAAWDRVYNTFCLRQEFERALADFTPRTPHWPASNGRSLDPYRKGVVWRDDTHRIQDLDHHRRTAREALTRCDALVVTVGLNELWYDKTSGDVFYQVPPPDVFDTERHGFRTATVDENLANLERMHALLTQANPGCQMLVTVSPVPLRATFRRDHNVVVNNAESKATLLVAAKAFVARHDDVHYFPSYELVQHAIRDPFEPDNRHVKRSTVDAIMRVFEATFVTETEMAPT